MRVLGPQAPFTVALAGIGERLDRIEALLAAQADELEGRPTQADLIDLRMHTTRIAAEVGRLATELRAEVHEIKDETDRASVARSDDVLELPGAASA